MKINQNVKLRVGGRKAPSLSIQEFRDIITKIGQKILPEDYDDVDIQDMLTGDDNFWIFYSDHSCLAKLRKDIEKIEVDLENVNQQGEPKQTSHGIPYLIFEVGGDWEYPVCIFVYWDGKYLRAYIPEKGNTYRRDLKCAFGNNDDDNEYLRKTFGSPGIWNLEIDYPNCLQDFESRLEVI